MTGLHISQTPKRVWPGCNMRAGETILQMSSWHPERLRVQQRGRRSFMWCLVTYDSPFHPIHLEPHQNALGLGQGLRFCVCKKRRFSWSVDHTLRSKGLSHKEKVTSVSLGHKCILEVRGRTETCSHPSTSPGKRCRCTDMRGAVYETVLVYFLRAPWLYE